MKLDIPVKHDMREREGRGAQGGGWPGNHVGGRKHSEEVVEG